MRAGWAYFVSFQQAAKDFAEFAKTKLTIPVLAIDGERSLGAVLADQMMLVASDVTVATLKIQAIGCWSNGLMKRPKHCKSFSEIEGAESP
jgi:hypothetical protein